MHKRTTQNVHFEFEFFLFFISINFRKFRRGKVMRISDIKVIFWNEKGEEKTLRATG